VTGICGAAPAKRPKACIGSNYEFSSKSKMFNSLLNRCGQQLELIGPLRLYGPPISALTDDFATFESENVEKFHLKPHVWRQPKR